MLLLLTIASAQDCQPGQDCDGDGYTLADGDCNEADASVNPGALEDCTNELDDNCDGLFNEGCDASVRQGAPWGGGLCRHTQGAAWLALAPLWGLRRRR